jgi:preprotein translocase subunit SecA
MIKHLDKFLLGRSLKKYRTEAQIIQHHSLGLQDVPDGSLANSFQNLRGRTDRDAMQVGFAIIIEMAERTLGIRPYEVQIMGALAMADGRIAEMATGEGKTLTAALPLAWHGLQTRAHAMTVNDYLAKRDAQGLDPLFESLGLTVGYLQDNFGRELRQGTYQCSIVYGTPTQFVFDYLRDHVVHNHAQLMQQGREFLLVDEADSIFIDEARTPMVLSGEGALDASLWMDLYAFICTLTHEDMREDKRTQLEKILVENHGYESHLIIDRIKSSAFFSESGITVVEDYLMARGVISTRDEIWQPARSHIWRALNACAKAAHLYAVDRDYILSDDKAIIVDQETGRLSHGKRWNDGLHQAIEAKESLSIKPESEELGRIALSNYVSLYSSVGGMTGTAMTEAKEIQDLYGLTTVPIPTHKPKIRIDHSDIVFMTQEGKWSKIIEDAKAIHARKQPLLIGTGSISDSELISRRFEALGIPHQVLNAKQDENEAKIVSQAGRLGAITIATNMAGRGTDIILGGNPELMLEDDPAEEALINLKQACKAEREEVIKAGGLFVMGCERGDSRRLDLQLAGRAGRQGDPGASRFYIALDDPLLKNYGGDALKRLFLGLGIGENDGVEHSMVDSAIAKAQAKKQAMHMTSRKEGLKQDSVIDKPRHVFFKMRDELLAEDVGTVFDLTCIKVDEALERMLAVYLNNGQGFPESWNKQGLREKLVGWGLSGDWFDGMYADFEKDQFKIKNFHEQLLNWVQFDLRARSTQLQEKRDAMIHSCLLHAIDTQWKTMLEESDHIRTGIHLRAYAQEKPDLSFQKEIFKLFKALYFDIPVVMIDYVYACIAHRERELGQVEQTAA